MSFCVSLGNSNKSCLSTLWLFWLFRTSRIFLNELPLYFKAMNQPSTFRDHYDSHVLNTHSNSAPLCNHVYFASGFKQIMQVIHFDNFHHYWNLGAHFSGNIFSVRGQPSQCCFKTLFLHSLVYFSKSGYMGLLGIHSCGEWMN